MNLTRLIKNVPALHLIFYIWLCSLIVNIIIHGTFYLFGLNNIIFLIEQTEKSSISFYKVIAAICIAPIVETFFFQALPFYFFTLFTLFKKKKIYIVLISAAFFAFCHFDSLSRFITVFLCGLILETVFILREKDRFWIVCIAHCFWNASVITILAILDRIIYGF